MTPTSATNMGGPLRYDGKVVLVTGAGQGSLKNKEGEVTFLREGAEPEWTAGQVDKLDTCVVVTCSLGKQRYTLLDHITVKLSLQDSWAHASTLKLQLYSKKPLHNPTHNTARVSKQQKDSIIKVSSAAVEKRLQLEAHDLGENFEKLKLEYGQTDDDKSLYNMFLSFKESSLLVNR